jgi:hypothetical protein
MDYYFSLMSGPVFLFQIFIIAPLPLPRDITLYQLLIIDLSKKKGGKKGGG